MYVAKVHGAPQKPNKVTARRQFLLDPADRLVNRLKPFLVDLSPKTVQGGGILERIKPRSLALFESHALSERMRHDQDIGKQDRGIEPEAPDRL